MKVPGRLHRRDQAIDDLLGQRNVRWKLDWPALGAQHRITELTNPNVGEACPNVIEAGFPNERHLIQASMQHDPAA